MLDGFAPAFCMGKTIVDCAHPIQMVEMVEFRAKMRRVFVNKRPQIIGQAKMVNKRTADTDLT
ncbi:hypothetical protein CUROG_00145 [Corynebacterium urogenitale]|uniref:Uncharacterized protein n=1 Tax=Corynebacterium urogenitale TaxID=2487892 RepID=A0A5J6Z349_9CORY|nr:hypothetical protein CUROG_00145 [Corynebacterium urogenitale]